MGRAKKLLDRRRRRSLRDEAAALDAVQRRRLETFDDWLLYGPRLR